VREDASGRYRVVLEEIPHLDLPDTPEGAAAFTARYVALLERTVREHPSQWVWQHRKWKNTPGISYD
jgi:lauroyl/myristoyl acyltransferase